MGCTVEIVFDRIPEITERVVAGAEALKADTEQKILERAQEQAPVGDPRHPDAAPGDLRDSGRVEDGAVVFDGTYGQAALNEFGTRNMAPQPFLGPAVQDAVPEFEAAVAALIAVADLGGYSAGGGAAAAEEGIAASASRFEGDASGAVMFFGTLLQNLFWSGIAMGIASDRQTGD